MEQLLTKILGGVYVLIGLWLVTIAPLIYIILSQLDRQGGKTSMPIVNVFQALFGMVKKTVKRRFALRLTKQKLINQGDVKPVPEVPPDLERWMARELLKELDTSKPIAKISLSVSTWVKSGRWIGTAEQFAALMDRWEVERIVCRKNRRGDRAFVQPSRPSISALLKAKVK